MTKATKKPVALKTKPSASEELPDNVLDKVAGGGNVPAQSDYPGKEEFANRGQDSNA